MHLKNILKVSGFTLVSRVFGLIRDILLSRYLGASQLADAFFVAFKIPNLFRRLFAEGSMQAVFIPIFSQLLGKNQQQARFFSSQVFTIFFSLLFIFVLLLEIFTPYVVMIISPGLIEQGEDVFSLAVNLLRITIPYLFFISVVSFYSSLLNSLNKFALVAFLPTLLNICIILGLLLFSSSSNIFINAAYAGAWGIFFGGLSQLIFVSWICYKNKWLVHFSFVRKIHLETKLFFKRILPIILGASFYQLNIIIDIFVASFLPSGSISYLFYADRIYQLPLALIGIAIATVMLPFISNPSINKKQKQRIQEKYLIFSLGISLFASVSLIVFAKEIITIIFLGGAFDQKAVYISSLILSIYSVSLCANIIVKVVLPIFYAQGDTKTPFYSTIFCLTLHLSLVFVLAKIFGVYGIAMSSVLVSFFNLIILCTFAVYKHNFYLTQHFSIEFKKILITFFILCLILLGVKFLTLSYLTVDLFLFRFIFIGIVISVILSIILILKMLKSIIYFEIMNLLKG